MQENDYIPGGESSRFPTNVSLQPVESAQYRHVLGYFATGVTVITALYQDQPIGFTANSFCSVSLSPPLISFCAGNSLSIWPLIEATGTFCVNILSEKQKELGLLFARKGADRFLGLDFRPAASGAPILSGVLAWLDCHMVMTLPAGDHIIALGQISDLAVASEGHPLIFYRGEFGSFDAHD